MTSRKGQTEISARPTHLSGLRSVVAASTHRFDKHCHDEFGIGVLTAGAQQSASGMGQVAASAGDVITVNYGEVHDGIPVGEAPRCWKMLYFQPDLLKSNLKKEGSLPDIERFEFVAPVVREQSLFRDVLKLNALLSQSQCDDVEHQFEELLISILGDLSHSPESGLSADHGGNLDAVIDFIEHNLFCKITLQDLANVADLSQYQLIRACKKTHGLTPHKLLTEKRLDAARRLISAGSPLADAAIEVGFADQSHMTRLFRRKYGLTPNAFATQNP
ncbi:MAG: AraC family transcriptional regulator [Pseudomonadota bacterium]